MGIAVLEFKNNAPSSTSAAYDITLRMIVDRLRMVSFWGGLLRHLIGKDGVLSYCVHFFGRVRCIVMDCQYHNTGIECDDYLLLGCGIIKELFDLFHCVFGGGVIFRDDGA